MGLDSLLANRVIKEVMRPNIELLWQAEITMLIGRDQCRQTNDAKPRLLVAEQDTARALKEIVS